MAFFIGKEKIWLSSKHKVDKRESVAKEQSDGQWTDNSQEKTSVSKGHSG